MSTLEYLGHSCFLLTAENGKTVLTDPYQGVGYALPKGLRADIVTVSHGHFDHNYVDGVSCKKVLSTPERYAKEGVEIVGIESYHDEKRGALRGRNIIYKIKVDGKIFCHMGDIGEEVSSARIENIGKVDVLFIPIGGTYTVDAQGAKRWIDAITPKVIVPMHYKPSDGSLDITSAQPFLSLCGGYTSIQGKMQIDEQTQGVYYMERNK